MCHFSFKLCHFSLNLCHHLIADFSKVLISFVANVIERKTDSHSRSIIFELLLLNARKGRTLPLYFEIQFSCYVIKNTHSRYAELICVNYSRNAASISLAGWAPWIGIDNFSKPNTIQDLLNKHNSKKRVLILNPHIDVIFRMIFPHQITYCNYLNWWIFKIAMHGLNQILAAIPSWTTNPRGSHKKLFLRLPKGKWKKNGYFTSSQMEVIKKNFFMPS